MNPETNPALTLAGPTRNAHTVIPAMLAAARRAETIIRDGAARRSSLVWTAKGPADYLTEIDAGAEAAIREVLNIAYPNAKIIGEEQWQGEVVSDGLCFVVDPLDGTTNFLHGLEEYAVSIAAVHNHYLIAGVVLHAARGDVYTAVAGEGAYHNEIDRLRVSTVSDPARALIATGFPFNQNSNLDRYVRQFAAVAQRTAGVRRPGAAALDFAHLAAGHYDAFWELRLAPWDMAAGMLLVQEAGGIVTDINGGPAKIAHGGFLAGNPAMHAWMFDVLQDADAAHGMGVASVAPEGERAVD